MLFNLIDIVLIFLLTAYLGNQGVLSAMLAFITATFASILAAAFYDPLQHFMANWWRPDFAQGLTFLILFLVAFVICRLAADFAVPENIKMSKTIDRTVGMLMGFFASLVIIGSILIGVQMMPLPSTLLGYNRFPGENGMQGDLPGVAAAPSNVWLAPDTFTVALWNLASGRSLGGDAAFADVHPHLLTELYGYRQTVQAGVTHSLSSDLLAVPTAWASKDPAVLASYQITEPGKVAVVVRAEVSQGSEGKSATNSSTGDGNPYFFITPSEVRIVTDKGHQYYPVGYLDKGRTFVPLTLDSGQLADDFPKGASKLVEEWVFQVNDDEKPQFVEIKQLARAPLTGILKSEPEPALASSAYSPHAYKGEQGTVDVTVTGIDADHLAGIKVYIIAAGTTKRQAGPLFQPAYANITAHLTQINDHEGLWSTLQGKPGIPNSGYFVAGHRQLQEFENKGPDDKMNWDEIVPWLFLGAAGPNGPDNPNIMARYYTETLVPAWSGPVIIKKGVTDASGKLELTDIPKNMLDIIAGARSENGFYVWAKRLDVKPKQTVNVNLSTSNAEFSITVK